MRVNIPKHESKGSRREKGTDGGKERGLLSGDCVVSILHFRNDECFVRVNISKRGC